MLYKNLPDDKLKSVMRRRCFLDYLAAFSFFLKGQFPNAWSVFQARRAYHQMRPDFFISRNMNMLAAAEHPAHTLWNKSILWVYYAQGKRVFAKLSN
jgi:hypothetical protein